MSNQVLSKDIQRVSRSITNYIVSVVELLGGQEDMQCDRTQLTEDNHLISVSFCIFASNPEKWITSTTSIVASVMKARTDNKFVVQVSRSGPEMYDITIHLWI
jgi:hypothetical protein